MSAATIARPDAAPVRHRRAVVHLFSTGDAVAAHALGVFEVPSFCGRWTPICRHAGRALVRGPHCRACVRRAGALPGCSCETCNIGAPLGSEQSSGERACDRTLRDV